MESNDSSCLVIRVQVGLLKLANDLLCFSSGLGEYSQCSLTCRELETWKQRASTNDGETQKHVKDMDYIVSLKF